MTTRPAPDLFASHVVTAAAECRGVAKAGGLADVVRELSAELARLGVDVTLVLPFYETLRIGPQRPDTLDLEPGIEFEVDFGGAHHPVRAWHAPIDGLHLHLLESDRFFAGEYGDIYIDSGLRGLGPFEDDAVRFAFFSAAVLAYIERSREWHPRPIDVLHCHDWHTATMLVLLQHDPRYRKLAASLRTVFSIHNLEYQGVRPFGWGRDRRTRPPAGTIETFSDWFPRVHRSLSLLQPSDGDPDASLLFNPMRAGINLADVVTTVSPRYASEITQPDAPERQLHRGAGLDRDLAGRAGHGELIGILNGLDYEHHAPEQLDPPFGADVPEWADARLAHKRTLIAELPEQLVELEMRIGSHFHNAARVQTRMMEFDADGWHRRPLLVAVTRAVSQKMSLLLEPSDDAPSVMHALLRREVSVLVIGTGRLGGGLDEVLNDPAHPNGLFIEAFDPAIARSLYAAGDIFVMPSDFEPCGISQMVAMRYGCLPLVHDVGGLHDTVQHGHNGFRFFGRDRQRTRRAFLQAVDAAVDQLNGDIAGWREMQIRAMRARFEWGRSAERYLEIFQRPENPRDQ